MRGFKRLSSSRMGVFHRWLAAAVFLLATSCGFLIALAEDSDADGVSPPLEVREAIRLLLSSNPRVEKRGEAVLRRMGASVVPMLRFWVRKVRSEAKRVELMLRQLEGLEPSEHALERMTTSDFFYSKLLDAKAYEAEGKHREALRILEAILTLDPDNPLGWEMRRLSRRVKQRLAARELLEPTLEAGKLAHEIGEEPTVLFRLVNHKRSVVRIELEKGVLGELDMSVTKRFHDGSMQSNRTKLRIQLDEEVESIVIGPGQAWEHPVKIRFERSLPLSGLVIRVQMAGRFRPRRWNGDGTQDLENMTLSVPSMELWIVPPGQNKLCERPLEKLTAALLFGKEEPFFVAGWLAVWAGEGDPYMNEKLLETLITHSDDLDPTRLAIAAQLLEEATWLEFGTTAERWKDWWKTRTLGREELGNGPALLPGKAKRERKLEGS